MLNNNPSKKRRRGQTQPTRLTFLTYLFDFMQGTNKSDPSQADFADFDFGSLLDRYLQGSQRTKRGTLIQFEQTETKKRA